MKIVSTLLCLILISVQSIHAQNPGRRVPVGGDPTVHAPQPGMPLKGEPIVQVPGPLGSVPYVEGDPCPDIPFCCPGPGNYPTAPTHGTGCALTVAAMAVPIILIAGVAAVILITSQPKNP